MMTTFDAAHAVLEDYLDGSVYPPQLTVTATQPLHTALADGVIAADQPALTFELDGVLHVVPMNVVLSYNVIQGDNWVMTFCNACNTGMVFDPVLNGQRLHFQRRGSYDGLMLIWDAETDSYWQHITGTALYGSSIGQQLRSLTTTRQMTIAEAAARGTSALLLTSTLSAEQERIVEFADDMRHNPASVEHLITATIDHEDTRRPRFELGLGVWNGHSSIFFPLVLLHAADNALITEFDGRPLLIYQTPGAIAPVAAFVPAQWAAWEGDVLRLDGGRSIHNDQYFSGTDQPQPLVNPSQLLMRWYGFALTFPGCEVAEMAA